jgi:hypothetical protein
MLSFAVAIDAFSCQAQGLAARDEKIAEKIAPCTMNQ